MLERVIENWLDKSTERSWQQPFCAMLAAQGHRVIHSTRHNELELGVDVLSVDPDGVPWACQLKTAKSRRITVSEWREINAQLDDLVCRQIEHPSLRTDRPHRSFLVTNGNLDEAVIRAINDRNLQWAKQKCPQRKIETLLRGDMLDWAKKLGTSLWPSELYEMKLLLELLLESGCGPLPKPKLVALLESVCPIRDEDKNPGNQRCERALSASSLLCAIAISRFAEQDNHIAKLEAWTTYAACCLATAERWRLPKAQYQNEFALCMEFLWATMQQLCDEVRSRDILLEGDKLLDKPFGFYRVRITLVVSILSIFGLWRRHTRIEESETDEFISDFVQDHLPEMLLWGEGAIPQFLATFWYLRQIDSTLRSEAFLRSVLEAVTRLNQPGSDSALIDPYYSASEVLLHSSGLKEKSIEGDFHGSSHAIEGLMHLFVRQNWKRAMKLLWPDISRICFESFQCATPWHFYRFRNCDAGVNVTKVPRRTRVWDDLRVESSEEAGEVIPGLLKKHPVLALLFICVYPHRLCSSAVRWLDSRLHIDRD